MCKKNAKKSACYCLALKEIRKDKSVLIVLSKLIFHKNPFQTVFQLTEATYDKKREADRRTQAEKAQSFFAIAPIIFDVSAT
jgi:hypothetical protein